MFQFPALAQLLYSTQYMTYKISLYFNRNSVHTNLFTFQRDMDWN